MAEDVSAEREPTPGEAEWDAYEARSEEHDVGEAWCVAALAVEHARAQFKRFEHAVDAVERARRRAESARADFFRALRLMEDAARLYALRKGIVGWS